ncbi:MAG: histidine kinase [Lewinellaceae bacterium]|nr:histidine kinase [Lewinellaceae bacterium]
MKRAIFIFFILLGLSLNAQVPLVKLRTSQEMTALEFTTIYQDSSGWIWLGTKSGIYKYDGLDIIPLGVPDVLDSIEVTAIFEHDDRLWVGYKNGAIAFLDNLSGTTFFPSTGNEYNPLLPQLQLWEPEEGLPTASISGFVVDMNNGLWISTYGEGLYVWEMKQERMYQFDHAGDGLSSNDIYSITRDMFGKIWAATDAGISICSMPEPGKKQVKKITKSDGLPDEIITCLYTDLQGNIWGGTDEKGVFKYDPREYKVLFQSNNWSFGAITRLAVFGNDELWIGTKKDGMIHLSIPENIPVALPSEHALRHNKVISVMKDREGLLWLATNRGQLFSANVRFCEEETPFQQIQAICTDKQGNFWLGSRTGLFVRNGSKYKQVLSDEINVVSLWVSPVDGKIWVGTLGKGIYLADPGTHKAVHLPANTDEINEGVLSIAGDSNKVWLATLDGVTVVDPVTLQPDKSIIPPELAANYVYKVLSDKKGRIWFGTDGVGLGLFDSGKFYLFDKANGTELRTIYSIAEDYQGNIWFSTARTGLFQYDGQNFKNYTTENNLHSMDITGLAVDGKNQLVIGYEDGFDILNTERFDHFNFCSEKTGAPNINVNLNALWTDASGHVWLGSENGIVRSAAYKEDLTDDPQPGIIGISVFLQPIDFSKRTVFDHDQNNFLINFIGLWYTNPESVRYRYRLDGYDTEWKISKDHTCSYPKLPPGNYVFRLQASEHGNFANVPEVSWNFTISQPFWKRWWFIGLSGIALFGLFNAYIKSRENRLKREDQLKRENMESQFEALKSQINPHFLFNSFNTLITIIEENPNLAVEYVEHLSDFYRSIMVYRERDFITVNEEMELVRSFYFLLKKRYEDGLIFIDHVSDQDGKVMPLSLQILVENAVKHNIISASKPLTIEVYVLDNYLVVKNNIQRKIKSEPSTRFGLHSLVNRYKLLGERSVVVEENPAFFIVRIPIL